MRRALVLLVLLAVVAASALARASLERGRGLQGQYTTARQWGLETRGRVDGQISTTVMSRAWDDSPPARFRARWTGFIVVGRSRWYTFATTSDDGSTVRIDGLLVVDNRGDHVPLTRTGPIRLAPGAHPVVIEYAQSGGGYELELAWADGTSRLSPVPSWALWTAPVTYRRAVAARLVSPIPYVALATFVLMGLWTVSRQLSGRTAMLLRAHWPLLLILLFGAYFRFQYVQLPMADAHGWRQIFNADVARNFNEQSLNILYPRVNWGGGGDAYVAMEFPLLQWTAALLFRLFGERDIVCRLLAITFSLATIIGLYGLANCLWGRAVGRAAAFFFAISPSAIFFGRAFISDTPMICFSILGVWGFASFLSTGRRAPLVLGTTAGALACMVKLPAVIIFAPIAWLAWQFKGWAFVRDRALIAGLAAMFLLTVAWYGYDELLFRRTALGVAIFHSAGGYGADVMEGAGPVTLVSSWNTWAEIRNPEYYRTLGERFWRLHFTPLGAVLIAIGAAVFWRDPKRRFVDVWFGSAALFILLAAEGNRWHEFYQMPILLPAALYFALAARPLFDYGWLSRRAPYRLGVAACAVGLVVVGVKSFEYSRVVPELFRPHQLRLRPISVGQRLQELTPPGALLITVEYERYGGNSPVLLHYARRHGWSFDATAITPEVIQRLHERFGARYFVTLIWSELAERQPDVAAYLKTQQEIPVDAGDVALFALR